MIKTSVFQIDIQDVENILSNFFGKAFGSFQNQTEFPKYQLGGDKSLCHERPNFFSFYADKETPSTYS
jgi:hypothetical protein